MYFSASPCLQLLNSSIQQQNVQPARGMANLKAIAIRLKSVKNIQKITQSMKMVSAAKYARAERDLKVLRIDFRSMCLGKILIYLLMFSSTALNKTILSISGG